MPFHTASREKVCALCWNRRGKKVERVIKEGSEIEQALDEHVVPGYKADSLHVASVWIAGSGLWNMPTKSQTQEN